MLHEPCDAYTDIFSKHSTDIGKTDLVQMTLINKDNLKPLDQKPYILPLKHHASLNKSQQTCKKQGLYPPLLQILHLQVYSSKGKESILT